MTQRHLSKLPAHTLFRLLAMVVPVLILLAGTAPAASAARIKGPRQVAPGKVFVLRVSGLRPHAGYAIRIQPSTTPKDRPGLDGALIQSDVHGKGLEADASGRALARIRFPKRRLQCGFSCGGHALWKKGSWVDIDIPRYAPGKVLSPVARTRARIRGGKRSGRRHTVAAVAGGDKQGAPSASASLATRTCGIPPGDGAYNFVKTRGVSCRVGGKVANRARKRFCSHHNSCLLQGSVSTTHVYRGRTRYRGWKCRLKVGWEGGSIKCTKGPRWILKAYAS